MLNCLNVDRKTDAKSIEVIIGEIMKNTDIELAEKQKEAIRLAASKGVLVITGGPGTGKTTTLNSIIEYLEIEGREYALCAPTGRAAKRMKEATGREASTIHRLLEQTGGIVQGMSGSPILQNGKLVGAVTHVLVRDPTRGYGILIGHMLEGADQAANAA